MLEILLAAYASAGQGGREIALPFRPTGVTRPVDLWRRQARSRPTPATISEPAPPSGVSATPPCRAPEMIDRERRDADPARSALPPRLPGASGRRARRPPASRAAEASRVCLNGAPAGKRPEFAPVASQAPAPRHTKEAPVTSDCHRPARRRAGRSRRRSRRDPAAIAGQRSRASREDAAHALGAATRSMPRHSAAVRRSTFLSARERTTSRNARDRIFVSRSFTSSSVQKNCCASCTHSKYETVTPPAFARMSGTTKTPRSRRISSASSVVGPLAPSTMRRRADAVGVAARDLVLDRGRESGRRIELEQLPVRDALGAREALEVAVPLHPGCRPSPGRSRSGRGCRPSRRRPRSRARRPRHASARRSSPRCRSPARPRARPGSACAGGERLGGRR